MQSSILLLDRMDKYSHESLQRKSESSGTVGGLKERANTLRAGLGQHRSDEHASWLSCTWPPSHATCDSHGACSRAVPTAHLLLPKPVIHAAISKEAGQKTYCIS